MNADNAEAKKSRNPESDPNYPSIERLGGRISRETFPSDEIQQQNFSVEVRKVFPSLTWNSVLESQLHTKSNSNFRKFHTTEGRPSST